MIQSILKPLISEKSMSKVTDANEYTFKVRRGANKHQIASEIAKQYKVEVISVRIINKQGKVKRFRGKISGKTKDFKKAIIKLKKGQKIADYSVK